MSINADIASVILEYANYFQHADDLNKIFPGCKRQCYNMNIKKIVNSVVTVYRLFGKLHR